jgi:hypothetical protein
MRRSMIAIVAAFLGILAGTQGAVAYNAVPRIVVSPRVANALHQAGLPARVQCGEVADSGRPTRTVPGCWIVVERRGYSVHVVPHSTGRAATVAYERTYNRWAKRTRMAIVRNLVVYGFRVPASDWLTIRRLVVRATA